jgi:hypothetical protein
MSKKIIVIIAILMVFTIFPSSNAQLSLGAEADQKSIEVEITSLGEVNVKHVVKPSNFPVSVDLFDGTISDISITNESGDERDVAVVGDDDAVLIFPSNQNSIVEYSLENVLILNDNLWSFEISYPQTVSVITPEEIDQVYVNNIPIQLGDNKGIGCHGCYMNLQYYSIIPKIIQEVEWEEDSFVVEIITDSEIEKFNFDQSEKSISFQVNDENKFITTIIPLELVEGPYVVSLDDDKILFHKSMNSETHITLDFIPKTSGEITITGTTVITSPVELIDSSPESNYLIYVIVGGIVASAIIATIIRVKQRTTKLTQNQ